jgi:prepilin-type N-terminal cleavage/methylation domain-containing protein
MRTHIHHARGDQGFTLVESLIAVTFLAVLFLAVAQTSSRASDAFDEGSTEHALSTGTHRALERIAHAIDFSDGTILPGIDPTLGSDQVTFRVPGPFESDVVTWVPMEVLTEMDGGELDDGADNNGDGLVDERRVVLVEAAGQPDERRVVLVGGVTELYAGETANNADDNGNGVTDETGLSFSVVGNVVTIRLCCQRQDEGRRLLTKTAETAVRLRNN